MFRRKTNDCTAANLGANVLKSMSPEYVRRCARKTQAFIRAYEAVNCGEIPPAGSQRDTDRASQTYKCHRNIDTSFVHCCHGQVDLIAYTHAYVLIYLGLLLIAFISQLDKKHLRQTSL